MLRNDRQLILADFLNEDECSLPRPMRFSAAAGKFRICLYISIHFPPIGHLSAEKMRKTRLRILENEGMEGRGREQRKKDGKERAPYRQRRGKLKGTGGSCVPGMPLSETKKAPEGFFRLPGAVPSGFRRAAKRRFPSTLSRFRAGLFFHTFCRIFCRKKFAEKSGAQNKNSPDDLAPCQHFL